MWVTDEAETPKKKKKKGTGYDMAMGLPGQMKVKLPELPPAQPGLPGRLFSTVVRFTSSNGELTELVVFLQGRVSLSPIVGFLSHSLGIS